MCILSSLPLDLDQVPQSICQACHAVMQTVPYTSSNGIRSYYTRVMVNDSDVSIEAISGILGKNAIMAERLAGILEELAG